MSSKFYTLIGHGYVVPAIVNVVTATTIADENFDVVLVIVNAITATTITNKHFNAVPAASVHAMIQTEELSDVVLVGASVVGSSEDTFGKSQLCTVE